VPIFGFILLYLLIWAWALVVVFPPYSAHVFQFLAM